MEPLCYFKKLTRPFMAALLDAMQEARHHTMTIEDVKLVFTVLPLGIG